MMAGVPQKTLNWLYDVLKREYHDPNRTYSDVAQTLAQFPGLAPRTDVYTSENGAPALLLNLKGTLPVNFRGTVYQFPIAIWIPHAYPREAPIAYVTPTGDMVVRPGQHVSASDGKIYHQYLARWRDTWDRSNVIEFMSVLIEIFSREPPVMAKGPPVLPQAQQHQQQPPPGGPPSVPPPPQDPRRYSSQPPLPNIPGRMGSPGQTGPPPPPPKQATDATRPISTGPPPPAPKPSRYDAPPPLPQQIQPQRSGPLQQPYSNGTAQPPISSAQYMPQRTSSLRQEYHGREQPPMPQQYRPQSPARPPQLQAHPSAQSPNLQRYSTPPPPPTQTPHQYAQASVGLPQQPPASPQAYHNQQFQQGPKSYNQPPHSQQQQPRPQSYHQPQPPQQQQQIYPHQHPQAQQIPQRQSTPVTQPPKPAPPKDLLSEDDPFQINLAKGPQTNLPPPPIPTNPEKTALLSHLSHLTLQHLQNLIQQTQTTALPSLHSQHTALQSASNTLNTELSQLQSLHAQLQSNISALQSTISNANATIAHTQDPKHPSHPDNIPVIDQIIIPPSVVARQLYDTVAEQRGYEAAIFALNEAFVRGRIGSEVWGRKVRECAREEMRRKWLVRKIGEGLGLEEV